MPERRRIYPALQESELHVPVSPTEELLVRTPEASIQHAYKLGLLDGKNLLNLLDYALHSLQMAEQHAQAMHVCFHEFLKNYILDTPRPDRLESDEEQQKAALTEARDVSATFMLKEITTVLSDIVEYYVKTAKLIDTTELQTLLSHKLAAQESRPKLLTTKLSTASASSHEAL